MLPAAAGQDDQRLALWHPPLGDLRGLVLYVHPFAEEMNKARRMAALQARALATAGFGVLQMDLKGCGDSSGDFGDATWADWVADVQAGLHWLRRQGRAPLTLWGLRAGCLLAAEAAIASPQEIYHFVFWQPTPKGASVLRQFLRAAAASAWVDGAGKGVVEGLRKQLADGQSVQVSGYRLHPQLAAGLDAAQLKAPAQVGRVVWFESGARTDTIDPAPGRADLHAMGPASSSAAVPWQAAATRFNWQALRFPSFWQSTEIEEAPDLIQATTAALAAQA